MQAVSFMYVRPPGFNAESAKAAEMDDQRKKEEMVNQQSNADGLSSSLYLHPTLCLVLFFSSII